MERCDSKGTTEVQLDPKARELGVAEGVVIDTDPAEEKRVLRKIDLCILPLMAGSYMLAYMDKVALSNAAIMGIIKDTNLTGSDFSWASSVFYFGYLGWSWPSSYLIVKFPLGKYLAVTVAVWGVTLMCHAACHNFTGLMIARFFLGVTEAAMSPGLALIVGMFYKRHEQPLRQNAWVSGNGVGNLINGVASYGISRITGASLAPWRVLFLIYGSVTVVYAIVLYLVLPASPATAPFLKPREREVALHRTLENKTGVEDQNTYKISQVFQALKDPQAWLMFTYMFAVSIPNGAITSFSGLIISGFGYSTFATLLLSMPAGGMQLLLLAITGFLTLRYHKVRMACMISLCIISIVGSVMMAVLPAEQKVSRLAGVYLTVAISINTPLLLSLVSSNVAGFTKKATVSAMIFIAYAGGNLAGPQFFLANEAPKYQTGLYAILSTLTIGTVVLILLTLYYLFENRRRDRDLAERNETIDELGEELSNLTDREMKGFRYVI